MKKEKKRRKEASQEREGGFAVLAILAFVVLLGASLLFYHSTISERVFFSPALYDNKMGDSPIRKVTIALPPDYYFNFARRYPVVYYLPGFNADNETDIRWVGKENVILFLDHLMERHLIKNLILVAPDPKNSFKGSFYTNSPLTGNWENYIVKDLVDFVDTHYRTIRSSKARGICGFSMGGYGAMMLAMKHPDVFGAVASFDAPLDLEAMKTVIPKIIAENPHGIKLATDNDKRFFTPAFLAMAAAFSPNLKKPPYFIDLPFKYPSPKIIPSVWQKWLDHDPSSLTKRYADNLKKLEIYIGVDSNDEFKITIPDEKFHKILSNLGVKHRFLLYPGTHGASLVQMTTMLEFLSSHLESAR